VIGRWANSHVMRKVVTLPPNSASLSSSCSFIKQLFPLLDSCSAFVGFVELLDELARIKDAVVRFPGVVGVAVSFPFDVEEKLLATN
jgi:hypothetical protein